LLLIASKIASRVFSGAHTAVVPAELKVMAGELVGLHNQSLRCLGLHCLNNFHTEPSLDGLIIDVALDSDYMGDHVTTPALLGIAVDSLDQPDGLPLGEVVSIEIKEHV